MISYKKKHNLGGGSLAFLKNDLCANYQLIVLKDGNCDPFFIYSQHPSSAILLRNSFFFFWEAHGFKLWAYILTRILRDQIKENKGKNCVEIYNL